MKSAQKLRKLQYRIINIRVNRAALIILLAFVCYAAIDVCCKISTHNKYDMERLTKRIQETFPDSKLTFQNIKVVDNDYKIYKSRVSTSTYKETNHLYIRNGKIQEEPNFMIILYLFPIIMVLTTLVTINPHVKVKEIAKNS